MQTHFTFGSCRQLISMCENFFPWSVYLKRSRARQLVLLLFFIICVSDYAYVYHVYMHLQKYMGECLCALMFTWGHVHLKTRGQPSMSSTVTVHLVYETVSFTSLVDLTIQSHWLTRPKDPHVSALSMLGSQADHTLIFIPQTIFKFCDTWALNFSI